MIIHLVNSTQFNSVPKHLILVNYHIFHSERGKKKKKQTWSLVSGTISHSGRQCCHKGMKQVPRGGCRHWKWKYPEASIAVRREETLRRDTSDGDAP